MTEEVPPAPKPNPDAAAGGSPDTDGAEKLVLISPEDAHSPKDFALWAGVIVLVVLSVYSPAMHGRFLWDDDRHVENNRDLRDASGLGDIWTGHWRLLTMSPEQRKQMHGVYTPQYYPFTHTTYWIEAQIFGSVEGLNPTVFHVTNVLIHVAGAILLWFLLRELQVPGAWVIAAIFALHPINVESVAWISERKNVLAAALAFGSVLAYLKSPMGLRREDMAVGKDRDLTLYFVAVALFTLAVLSKTVACSAPAVILLLTWWKRGKLTAMDVAWTAPMFVIGLALSMFTSWIEVHHIGASGPEWQLSFVQHILLAGNAIWFYVGKLLLPLKLTFIYPKWNLDPARPELWIGPIAVVAVLGILFALRNRIGRGPIAGALIFVGVLVPALGFFSVYPMKYSYVADHFQYLAGPALIALIVAALAKPLRKLPPAGPYLVVGVILMVLAVLTALQSAIFAGPLELWADTARKNPNSAMVRYNVGLSRFISAGELTGEQLVEFDQRVGEARDDFEAATKIDPSHDKAWELWGETLLALKQPAEAIAKFDHVLEMDRQRQENEATKLLPRDPAVDAAMNRGRALIELKRPDDAIASYASALEILRSQRPLASRVKAATSYGNIGKLLAQKGDTKKAVENLQQAIEIEPRVAFPHHEYALILAAAGKKPEAAVEFAKAINAQPSYIEPRLALGRMMLDVGNFTGAQQQFAAAVRINPNHPGVREAAVAFDAALRKAEAAATQPSTTRSTTTRAATTRASTTTQFTAPSATLQIKS